MRIYSGNYYLSAISSEARLNESKAKLGKVLFWAPRTAEAFTDYAGNKCLYPLIAGSYHALGSVVSGSLSFVSKNLGSRVREAWTDPVSTSTILTASNWGQRIITPVAKCEPLKYPILRPITQSIIGLARFSDIALKDASTVLALPARITKLFSSSWLAISSDYDTFLGRAVAKEVYTFIGACLLAIRIIDVVVGFFQSIAYQIHVGRDFTDATCKYIKNIEHRFKEYSINKIQCRETRARKKLVGKIAAAGTKKVCRLWTSSTFRWMIGYGLLYLAASHVKAFDPTHSWISPEAERTLVWLTEKATIQTFAGLSLAYKTCAYAAFFKEFIHTVTPEYDPKSHTLFYKQYLIRGYFSLRNIEKHLKNTN